MTGWVVSVPFAPHSSPLPPHILYSPHIYGGGWWVGGPHYPTPPSFPPHTLHLFLCPHLPHIVFPPPHICDPLFPHLTFDRRPLIQVGWTGVGDSDPFFPFDPPHILASSQSHICYYSQACWVVFVVLLLCIIPIVCYSHCYPFHGWWVMEQNRWRYCDLTPSFIYNIIYPHYLLFPVSPPHSVMHSFCGVVVEGGDANPPHLHLFPISLWYFSTFPPIQPHSPIIMPSPPFLSPVLLTSVIPLCCCVVALLL